MIPQPLKIPTTLPIFKHKRFDNSLNLLYRAVDVATSGHLNLSQAAANLAMTDKNRGTLAMKH